MGIKRADHVMYPRDQGITAAEALDWGLVGEVHPRTNLMPRAREMAAHISSAISVAAACFLRLVW
jgi:enoyl-CoA hydratase/carnithine racemase